MSDTALPSIVEFSSDLSKAEAPEPLPVGEYEANITAAEIKTSQKGTRYAEIRWNVSPDQYPADYGDGSPNGATLIYRRVSLEDNPQARWGTRQFIDAIGAPLGKKVDVNEWVGMDAVVEVDHETYEGVTRATVKRVRAS
tara:strand:+ start:142 stop:561 length:420 start_codon:yes stop_codon:yes gene_type:complete